MSKTVKTRPLWVKMLQYHKDGRKDIGIYEVHRHENGRECDLPETVEEQFTEENEKHYHSNDHCYWEWSYVGVQTCGCKMCTAQRERKQSTRAIRHAGAGSMQSLTREMRGIDLSNEEEILDALDGSERIVSPHKW